jgi:hypothetical protein
MALLTMLELLFFLKSLRTKSLEANTQWWWVVILTWSEVLRTKATTTLTGQEFTYSMIA